MTEKYDVVVIGGGPAGLTAGFYTSRAKINSLLIEKGLVGGQIADAEWVENYSGFPEGISGFELGQLMHQQATKYGIKILIAEVIDIALQDGHKVIKTTEGDFAAKAVIIAGGSERQRLGVPGEEEFTGRGVSYCATCDAALFREQPVAVVGGGNTALIEAIFLKQIGCKDVYVIHRRDQLRAEKAYENNALEKGVKIIYHTHVDKILGEQKVAALELHNVKTKEKSKLPVDGVFISI